MRRQRRVALVAPALAGAVLFAVAYSSMEPPAAVAQVALAVPSVPANLEFRPEPVPPLAPTVKLVNPFDPTEVFEFPPGTSDIEARESAASFLLERARQRLAGSAEPERAM